MKEFRQHKERDNSLSSLFYTIITCPYGSGFVLDRDDKVSSPDAKSPPSPEGDPGPPRGKLRTMFGDV